MKTDERKIMEALIDKYESSKTFLNLNKVNQNINIHIIKIFPKYNDHSEYEIFKNVNDAIVFLSSKNFLSYKVNDSGVYKSVSLNKINVKEVYKYIKRKPKKELNIELLNLMNKYMFKNDLLTCYCTDQVRRMASNKPVKYLNNNIIDLKNMLEAVDEVFKIKSETFIRDFSIRLFKDSKTFEKIKSKTINLMFEYGEFDQKENILPDLNVIKNPTYVHFKGLGELEFEGQVIDLSKLDGDIAISSSLLNKIKKINIQCDSIITIENLTSFNTFENPNMFIIYLGGFHNKIRREFIMKIKEQNLNLEFYHFGDIDAGGFYILNHLRKRTGINFKPYRMDLETLKNNCNYTKSLTENDKKRLSKLKDGEFGEVVQYMLENDCKLEQEAVKE